jgi:hypothetical protein
LTGFARIRDQQTGLWFLSRLLGASQRSCSQVNIGPCINQTLWGRVLRRLGVPKPKSKDTSCNTSKTRNSSEINPRFLGILHYGSQSHHIRPTSGKAKGYEGCGHKFLEYRALRYIFRLCYSGPLKYRWQSKSHFRDWLPVIIGPFSDWRADVTATFRLSDHCKPCIPGTYDRVLRIWWEVASGTLHAA